MKDPIAILAEHAAGTLPDSITKRKSVLRAIQAVIKPSHPASRDVDLQLAALDEIAASQELLPLRFEEAK